MKVRFYHWYNAVLTALLSVLGYGCSSSDDDSLICEYGVPTADYVVKGIVTDEQGTPIEGIKVSTKHVSRDLEAMGIHEAYTIDSLQTDAAGRYTLTNGAYYYYNDFKLFVEDIDGEANGGTFKSDTIDVDFQKAVQIKEGSRWYSGTFEINQDIQLKKQ